MCGKKKFATEDQAKELDLLYHWNRHTIQAKLWVEVMFTYAAEVHADCF